MQSYRMIIQSAIGHLGWEYNFTASSDKFAAEYAARHMPAFKCCDWVYSILVFQIIPEERLVACVTLPKVEAEITNRGPE